MRNHKRHQITPQSCYWTDIIYNIIIKIIKNVNSTNVTARLIIVEIILKTIELHPHQCKIVLVYCNVLRYKLHDSVENYTAHSAFSIVHLVALTAMTIHECSFSPVV